MGHGVAAIRADDEVRARDAFAIGCFHAHPNDTLVLDHQIGNFMLHMERERREFPGMTGEEIQEIPLRHEGDELAAGGQVREIRHRHHVPVHDGAQLAQFLVRQLEKFLQQPELMHEFERGRMNRVAAEIAVEIGVLLEHRHVHAGAGQQIAAHHSRRTAAHNDAARSDLRR